LQTSSLLGQTALPCDTVAVLQQLESINHLPTYDTVTFRPNSLHELPKAQNRQLWFRDFEMPYKTRFTPRWNDYHIANYRAKHLDFVAYYRGKANITLAFQIGPNYQDLWAFHISVIRKIGDCFLITRSYFRHARFTYKAYAWLNAEQVDKFFDLINAVNTLKVTEKEPEGYTAFFADNRNKKTFYIDFKAETDPKTKEPTEALKNFVQFFDVGIPWRLSYESYSLLTQGPYLR